MAPAGATAARPGPGRPSTGARERILDAALAILKRDGYAGLTTARVADLAGQNKALISYHFGGKQGLVAEVARGVAELITSRTREAIAGADDGSTLAGAIVDAVFGIIEATLKETLPVATLVFVPPGVDDPYDFQTPYYHSTEVFEYAMKALSKKLAAMGLDPAALAA